MQDGVKRYSFRHITYKIKSLIIGKLHPDWPWWSAEAVSVCDRLVKPTDKILEFGSGRSTIWLSSRCKNITSIENDESWYKNVKAKISQLNLANKAELIYAPLDKNGTLENQTYLAPVKKIQDSSLDVIIIDGKLRSYCTNLSLPLLKPGGVLIIDDADRFFVNKKLNNIPNDLYQTEWDEIGKKLAEWRSLWTTDGMHATLFLFKP